MVKQIGIDGIYVIHAKQGYEIHEDHVNTLFKKHRLEHTFMTDGDPSLFNDTLLNTYFTPTIKDKLSIGVLSCTLNHILSYEAALKNKNRFALIFENDPFFLGDFVRDITRIIEEAKTLEPGFIISLENTSLRFPKYKTIKRNKHLYPATQGRCAGAYLIDSKGIENILTELKTTKCNEVIDWWHNGLIEKNIIKMYWAYPAITEQGSHNGLLSSTISTKERSTKRRIKWFIQRMYKTHFLRYIK
ncbi:glycosyltransferase family 25 protein [uncultured Cytophaga sp.]|uniref:glycosyltransferase family 25 protein n=1 Tax=uncultured Cytophaga sp. TaxID=160238 RepID=UPI00261E8296|nr:glycosyltransferase family 25 protein [uncultured Cytophaga sp.]